MLAVTADKAADLEALADGLPLSKIGVTTGTELKFGDTVTISVEQLHELNEGLVSGPDARIEVSHADERR